MKWFFILSGAVYFLQGIEGLPGLAISLWLKETVHLKDFELQRMMSYVTLAWLIKPLWGYFIDKYFTKASWVKFSLLMGMGLIAVLAMAPFSVSTLWLLVAMMALLNWTMAIRDVANDGIACVEGKRTGTTGKFQSIQWGSVTFAALLASLGGGWVATHLTWQWGYAILFPLLLLGWGLVHRIPPTAGVTDKCKIELGRYKELLSKDFLILSLFIWLFNTAPSFAAPLFYKQRDVFHWTPMMIAYLGVFVAVLDIIGAAIYSKFCKVLPIKKILVGSIIFFAPTTLCYLHYTSTTAWIYSGVFATIGMIVFLVSMDLMARKSIAGLEATSFAMLCSIANFGSWCSQQMGSYCLEWWGLTPTIFINATFGLLALGVVPFIKWEEKC
jgi:MFS family permease